MDLLTYHNRKKVGGNVFTPYSLIRQNRTIPEFMGKCSTMGFDWSKFTTGITSVVKDVASIPITITGKRGTTFSTSGKGVSIISSPVVTPTTQQATVIPSETDTTAKVLKFAPLAIPFLLFFLNKGK